jgi:hypothetical protein
MRVRVIFSLVMTGLLLTSCSRTVQMSDAQPSGFLGNNYSKLEPVTCPR